MFQSDRTPLIANAQMALDAAARAAEAMGLATRIALE